MTVFLSSSTSTNTSTPRPPRPEVLQKRYGTQRILDSSKFKKYYVKNLKLSKKKIPL